MSQDKDEPPVKNTTEKREDRALSRIQGLFNRTRTQVVLPSDAPHAGGTTDPRQGARPTESIPTASAGIAPSTTIAPSALAEKVPEISKPPSPRGGQTSSKRPTLGQTTELVARARATRRVPRRTFPLYLREDLVESMVDPLAKELGLKRSTVVDLILQVFFKEPDDAGSAGEP